MVMSLLMYTFTPTFPGTHLGHKRSPWC